LTLSINSIREFIKRENELHLRGRTPKEANAELFRNLYGFDKIALVFIPLLVVMGFVWSAILTKSLAPGLILLVVVAGVALSFLFNPRFIDSLVLTIFAMFGLLCVGASLPASASPTMMFGVCALSFIGLLTRSRRTTLEMLDAKTAQRAGSNTETEASGIIT